MDSIDRFYIQAVIVVMAQLLLGSFFESLLPCRRAGFWVDVLEKE